MSDTNAPYYEMFSPAGDKACHSLVTKVVKKINGKTKVGKDEITSMVTEGVKKIALKHPEVNDTEPEWHVTERVNKALRENGYGFEVSRWDL